MFSHPNHNPSVYLLTQSIDFFIGMTTSLIGGTMTGVGHSQVDFPPDMIYYKDALLWYWLAENFFIWSASFAKLSIAVALLRLTVIKLHRYILWVVTALIIASGLLFGFILLFNCSPVSYFWMRSLSGSSGHCIPTSTTINVAYIYSVMSILADGTLGILPVFLVWKLQMNTRTKFAVGGILSLGAAASIGVIVRIPFMNEYSNPDFLYGLFGITICTTIENASAVIAGSLITLRPLFRWVLDRSIVSTKQRYKNDSQSYPLSSIKNENSAHPGTWRPDIEDAKNIVTTVTTPRKHRVFVHGEGDSSEEHLNPVPSHLNHVNIQETITVTERHG
ncbi:hypothetical protein N7495_008400 [Penicillium taxi]|uniref:uncharacterized protein n=1 Tax=Penicillium taxi TaxID=168475 RepID=UPI0025450DE0|nr:uncharacterized protein N7495_008400 [Penicillium taxi]KAJ5888359.1 hypothetical protein N7495_008400 [Penicillium taxi]